MQEIGDAHGEEVDVFARQHLAVIGVGFLDVVGLAERFEVVDGRRRNHLDVRQAGVGVGVKRGGEPGTDNGDAHFFHHPHVSFRG